MDRTSVHRHRDHLIAGEVAVGLNALWAQLEPPETPDELAPARRALRYLENRPGQLDYPPRSRPIYPSVPASLKAATAMSSNVASNFSGAWWLPENVHRMAQLRTTRANGAYAT